ncbi:MAG: thiamine pyrophosphate-binding protein, partial [Dehalococcoidia bacterium]|nr:thiamine pyrophosphate-binding protein [Dehalococcoidia bacterium]
MSICAEVIARTLKEAGVGSVFGLPGGEVLTLIEALRRDDVSFVLTRHEATAAFMADVTGQITRRPGVCLSTLGPGATNLVSGVANAYLDRSPVLAITGQMSTEALPFCSHQRIDLSALFQPVTKWSIVLDGRDSRGVVGKAIAIATQGRRGPVHLILPSNIARKEDEGHGSQEVTIEESSPVLDERLLEQAVGELARARHPLIILGIGVDPLATGQAINEFVEKTGIPVLTTPKAKGIVSESHPLFLAAAGGMAADEVVLELLEKADLLVGIGFDPVESDKIWHRQKKLLSIANASIADGDYAPALEVIGDVKVILGQILASYSPNHSWKEAEQRDFKSRVRAKLQPSASASSKGLSPYHLILRLRQLLSPSAVLTTDTGAHKLLLGQLWETYEPLTFFMSNGLS